MPEKINLVVFSKNSEFFEKIKKGLNSDFHNICFAKSFGTIALKISQEPNAQNVLIADGDSIDDNRLNEFTQYLLPSVVSIIAQDTFSSYRCGSFLEAGATDFVLKNKSFFENLDFFTSKAISAKLHTQKQKDTAKDYKTEKNSETEYEKNLLLTAIENSSNIVVITDVEGRVEYVNNSFVNVTGYSKFEAVGKKTSVLNSGSQNNDFYKDLWKIIGSGKIWQGEFINKKKDGSLYNESAVITPVFNEKGNISNYIAIKQDITELVSIREQMQKSYTYFETIIEMIPIPVFVKDSKGKYTLCNSAFCEYIDLSKEEIYEKGIKDLTSLENAQNHEGADSQLYNRGEGAVVKYELKVKHKKGIEKYVVIVKKIFKDTINGSLSIIGSIFDITERKKGEDSVLEAYKEAEKLRRESFEANRAKSRFLANMSHEIRTPMNSVLGFTELLLDEENNAEKKEMIEVIHKSGKNLLEIINNVLDISKIEEGKVDVNLTRFSLEDLIDNIFTTLKNEASKKGLKLEKIVEQGFPENIICDRLKVHQILLNLVSNAVKFTEKGSVSVRLLKKGHSFVIKVCDTGIGIREDIMDRIFDDFVQGEHYLTKKYQGTGLGLSIVKKLAEILKGTVNVESSNTKGSCFYIEIPFDIAPFKIKLESNEKSEIQLDISPIEKIGKLKVAIIDDSKSNQFLLMKIADELGWEYNVESDGKKALEMCKNTFFDVLLLDIQLPGINGVEIAKKIKLFQKNMSNKSVIIGISAFVQPETIQECLDAGMDSFITKPFVKSELLSEIYSVIDSKK